MTLPRPTRPRPVALAADLDPCLRAWVTCVKPRTPRAPNPHPQEVPMR